MFDFYLTVSNNHQPITWSKKPFSSKPWSLAVGTKLIEKEGTGWRMSGLGWDEEVTFFQENGSGFVAAIGEPFAGTDWIESHDGPKPYGRVPGETLARLWNQFGDDMAISLVGDYAIIALDGETREITLIGGRQSLRYLHYHADNNRTIISTSLHEAARLSDRDPVPDPAALVETALFAHPLGERTLWKGYSTLQPGEIVKIDYGNINRSSWFDYTELFSDLRALPFSEAKNVGQEVLKNAVRLLCDGTGKMRSALTSSPESRLIWSLIDHDSVDLLGYSFGVPGSLSFEKPRTIASKLGSSFQAVAFDEQFENEYSDHAHHALCLMDGLATFERANFLYGMQKTRGHSPFVITGAIGSQLLRTFQSIGWIVTGFGTKVALSDKPLTTFDDYYISASRYCPWIRPELFTYYRDEVHASLWDLLGSTISDFTPRTRFYLYLLRDALRKWFGSEILAERPFGTHRIPFWNDQFVDQVFRFPFASIAAPKLKPTLNNQYRSQKFYANTIKENNVALLYDNTDLGYPPADVIAPFGLMRMGARYLYKNMFRRKPLEKFQAEKWDNIYLNKILPDLKINHEYFTSAIVDDFNDGAWLDNRLGYARTTSQAITLAIWSGDLNC